MNNAVKKYSITAIKFLLIFGIFAVLFWRASQTDSFEILLSQEKNWFFLLIGFLVSFIGTLITFIRWQWLVRALDVPIRFRETIRLCFAGYICNYLPVGIIGGDVVKAWLLARYYPQSKAKAAASVLMDRVLGLYVMFVLGFIMIFLTGFINNTNQDARIANIAVIWFFILSTLGMIFLFYPESKSGLRKKLIMAIPFVGGILGKLVDAVEIYRHRPFVIIFSLLVTFLVHGSFAISFYFIALGLFGFAPSLLEHQVLYCISNIGTLIPLSAGPLEYFLDVLYPLFEIDNHVSYQAGYGLVIGLSSRIVGLLIASVGGLYLLGQSGITASLKEFNEEQIHSQTKEPSNDGNTNES